MDALLPKVYLMALSSHNAQLPGTVRETYLQSLSDLDEHVFGSEPVWPPGGEGFVHDVWYRDDLCFVFDHLFALSSKDTQRGSKVLPPPEHVDKKNQGNDD